MKFSVGDCVKVEHEKGQSVLLPVIEGSIKQL